MNRPRLLILSASTGGGHISAANAVLEAAQSAGLHARHVDVLDFTSRAFSTWYRGGYEVLVKNRPELWGHLYKSSDRPLFNYLFQTGLDWTFCQRLEDVIAEQKPDWIVCTHSLPQPVLSMFRPKYSYRVAVVVTDLYVHRMWLRGRPDWFFLPQPWSRDVLAKRRPRFAARADVTGIPVHPAFADAPSRAVARENLRLAPDERVVLMSAGGIGGGPVFEAARLLEQRDITALVVAGKNQTLHKELQLISNDSLRPFGQVTPQKMAELMSAGDLLVSKPGGLTTSESLVVGLPFVVYTPFLIPGQEEGNAEFLADIGAGVIADQRSLVPTVVDLLDDPARLARMASASKSAGLPDAASEIVVRLQSL